LAAFGGGVIADRLGGPTAVAVAGAVGVACALAYAGLRARSFERPPTFSARESIRALRERPVLGKVALAQGFYGGGLIAAVPLYALVHVDRLDLTLSEVGVIGILSAVATTIMFPVWGAVADRFGALVPLRVGSTLGVLCLIGYAVAPSVVLLWVMAFAFGAASASIDVGITAIVSAETPLASRAPAMAGWNAITGARGIAAAFLMSALLELGLVDVTSGLFLCALSSAFGVLLFARVDPNARARVPAARSVPAGSAVPTA
jgi:MFS family permease